jgi:predicted ATPase
MEFSKPKITSEKFIGRQNEQDYIKELLVKASSGKGNFLLVEGEAGIGKTRLISEIINTTKDLKLTYLRGKCKFHQGLDPYSPFIEALRDWFGISEKNIERNVFEKVHEKERDEQEPSEKDLIGRQIRAVSPELLSIIPLIRGFISAGTSLYGSYLFRGNNIDKSFRTYTELISEKKNGLIITRAHPEDLREQFKIQKTDFYWLTKSKTDIPAIDPSQIEKLRWVIKDFVTEHKDCVVLLDGLEYLILQNNFENVLKFVELLKDDIALNDAVLLLPIDPATLDTKQMALLERYMRVILSDKQNHDISLAKSVPPDKLDSSILSCLSMDNPLRNIDIDYEAEKDKMFQAILQLFKTISEQETLVLFLDDLHWADYSSMRLLQYLFQNTLDDKILIIGSYRPEDLVEDSNYLLNTRENIRKLDLEGRFLNLKLDRLNIKETTQIVKDILYDDVPSNFISLIFKKTEGNPLYIEEIIKSLLEDEIISLDNRSWYSKFDPSQVEIPDSISEVIQRRIDRIVKGNELIDQILKYTSIIGSTFSFDILLDSLNLDEEILLDNIEHLMLANIIHEVNEDRYKFDHTIIREVIYNSLGSRRKKILHAKVGYCIENLFTNNLQEYYAELAYHFSNGAVMNKAIFYSMKEGETAKELCAYDEALFHYKSALDMITADKEFGTVSDKRQLINLYLNLGDLSLILGAWNQAKEYFERSLEISKVSGDDIKSSESKSKLGEIEIKRKRWSEAIKRLEEILDYKLDKKSRNILLVTIKPKYIMRANITLIDILLKEELKGVYICINHPSHMIDKLLKTHKIPTEKLIYLDFITSITGSIPGLIDNAYVMEKAFSLEKLVDIFNINPMENSQLKNLDFQNIDFIMVDNVSNLISYTTNEKIEEFIKNLIDIIKKTTIAHGIVFIDSETSTEIHQTVQAYFDKLITIKEEWL